MNVPIIVEKDIDSEHSYDIFSRLLKERIIFISGEINDMLANNVIAELLYLDSVSNDDIYLYINSPGGSVTAGMAIYDTMNFIKSDVATICIGIAASMAAFLLSSGKKGKRSVLPNADGDIDTAGTLTLAAGATAYYKVQVVFTDKGAAQDALQGQNFVGTVVVSAAVQSGHLK